MKTQGQIVREWRIAAGFETAAALAELVGTSRQNIENLEKDIVENPKYLPRLARLMGYRTVEELMDLCDPPLIIENDPGVAQRLSPPSSTVAPQEVEWGSLKMKVPDAFKVSAPDEAMSPRVRAGQVLGFESVASGVVPRVGDGVLVRDSDGELHLRLYRQGRMRGWEAYAENQPAFRTLTPEEDGVEVLAVVVAVYGRWG